MCSVKMSPRSLKARALLVDCDLRCREQSSEYRAGGDQSKGGYGGVHKETENGGVESETLSTRPLGLSAQWTAGATRWEGCHVTVRQGSSCPAWKQSNHPFIHWLQKDLTRTLKAPKHFDRQPSWQTSSPSQHMSYFLEIFGFPKGDADL